MLAGVLGGGVKGRTIEAFLGTIAVQFQSNPPSSKYYNKANLNLFGGGGSCKKCNTCEAQ